MAVDFNNITDKTLNGNGWFEQFLKATRIQMKEALDANEVTQEIVGQVISQAVPAMMHEAVAFELQKDLADMEYKIKLEELNLKIKDQELMEADIALKQSQVQISEKELELKTAQLGIMEKEIDIKEREIAEKELTGTSQRNLIDAQVEETVEKTKVAGREYESYDDSLRVKKAEMRGNVASFYLNADPETAANSNIITLFNDAVNDII